MAVSTITRTHWTDDDGSGTTGTIINEAQLQAIYDAIDQLFAGAGSYTTFVIGGSLEVVGGAVTLDGLSSDPAASAANKATLYFNKTVNELRWSNQAGPYVPIGLPPWADPNACGGTAFGFGRT